MTPVYKTSDDQEHDTEELAREHQELLDAFEAHKEARQAYAMVLARTLKTADGEPLDLRRGGYRTDYWWIPEIYPDRPQLSQVSLYTWEVEMGEDGSVPVYRFYDDKTWGRQEGRWREIRPEELYASKEAAEAEFVKRMAAWTADQIRQMERYYGGFAAIGAALDRIGGLDQ